MLNNNERELFLACTDVISESELKDEFRHIDSSELETILNSFVEAEILYKEDEWYLTLPISRQKFYNNELIQRTDRELKVSN